MLGARLTQVLQHTLSRKLLIDTHLDVGALFGYKSVVVNVLQVFRFEFADALLAFHQRLHDSVIGGLAVGVFQPSVVIALGTSACSHGVGTGRFVRIHIAEVGLR